MSYYSEVVLNVEEYFRDHLPQYEVVEIRNKSVFPQDYYLFMVSAKKRNTETYAVWASWNQQIGSLNGGNYDLDSLEKCEQVFQEHYNSGK